MSTATTQLTVDGIGPADDWQGYWQRTDATKRKAASWAASRANA